MSRVNPVMAERRRRIQEVSGKIGSVGIDPRIVSHTQREAAAARDVNSMHGQGNIFNVGDYITSPHIEPESSKFKPAFRTSPIRARPLGHHLVVGAYGQAQQQRSQLQPLHNTWDSSARRHRHSPERYAPYGAWGEGAGGVPQPLVRKPIVRADEMANILHQQPHDKEEDAEGETHAQNDGARSGQQFNHGGEGAHTSGDESDSSLQRRHRNAKWKRDHYGPSPTQTKAPQPTTTAQLHNAQPTMTSQHQHAQLMESVFFNHAESQRSYLDFRP